MMKGFYRYMVLVFTGLLLIISCNKGSDSDDEYSNGTVEDPRFFGSMEAKINGELKIWRSARPLIFIDCGLFGCATADCFDQFQSGSGSPEPDSVNVSILFDIRDPEGYGCDFSARYMKREGDSIIDYATREITRDICEDDDPFAPRYICNDWSFNITPVGNNFYRGTFEFIATRNCAQDSVVITEGKFEIESRVPPCQ